MNKSEQLALVERVNRASEDEVKRALGYMILNCQINHHTIARAIKDGVERYTPSPTVVYEDQESIDDDEVILASSHKNSTEKEDVQSNDSEDEDAPATNSKHHRSTGRRDKKTKTKLQGKSRENGERHASSRDSSSNKNKKKKLKHAPRAQSEAQQTTSNGPTGRSSKKGNSTIIDLLTSSDVEAAEEEQPRNLKADRPVFEDDLDSVTSSEEEPSSTAAPKKHTLNSSIFNLDTDSSDGNSSPRKRQDFIAGAKRPSQGGSRAKTPQAGARAGDGGRRAKSVTVSAAKASNRHEDTKTGSLGLDKKRKAPDLAVENMRTNQPVNTAPVIHLSKRPKQNSPEEVQESEGGRKCGKCEKTFSIFELMKHRRICKGSAAAVDRHHQVSENGQAHEPKPAQKAGNVASDIVAAEQQSTVQLPSQPVQKAPAGRELSKPPPTFVHEPNSLARGPTPLPIALARSDPGMQSLPSYSLRPSKPEPSLGESPGHQPLPPRPGPPIQRPLPELEGTDGRRCIFCPKWFKHWENTEGVCKSHPGIYRRLTDVNLDEYRAKFGADPVEPFLAWSCCLRQGKYALPCRVGRHVWFRDPMEPQRAEWNS